jgi:hypothetical protein
MKAVNGGLHHPVQIVRNNCIFDPHCLFVKIARATVLKSDHYFEFRS